MRKVGAILMASLIPLGVLAVVANVGPLRKVFMPDTARFWPGA